MIVRWGLASLRSLFDELTIVRPYLLASSRWRRLDLDVEWSGRWEQVPSEAIDTVAAEASRADGLVAIGGGSAIDLTKAVSAATGLRQISIPTTYSGSEWTRFFGVRDAARRLKGGGSGALLTAIVYEPRLTVDLPRGATVGTSLNALAHCAEALYVAGRNPEGDRHALIGTAAIATRLPEVVASPTDVARRRSLLEGAMHAGAALASAGLGLGHAMAQALGGRFGLPHGAMNALCLPPALRFNLPFAAGSIGRFAEAMETDDPIGRTEQLAALGGFGRLRDYGVPEDALDEVAAIIVARPGARANPRPASAGDVVELLRSIY